MVCSLSLSFSSALLIMPNGYYNIPLSVKHCNLGIFLAGRTRNTFILDLNKFLEFSRRTFMLYIKKTYSPSPHLFIWQTFIPLLIFNLFFIEKLKRTVQLSKPPLSHLLELWQERQIDYWGVCGAWACREISCGKENSLLMRWAT